jgi:hypothetical protein
MKKLTIEQAAIISAYTGYAACHFSHVHELAERVLGRSIFSHEFGGVELMEKLQNAVRPMFIAICAEEQSK